MNKYLKIWLKSGSLFGISMGLFFIFQHMNYVVGLISGLGAGILFGASMASLTYFSDKKLKKQGIGNSSVDVNQTETVLLDRPYQTIKPEIENAIKLIRKAKITSNDLNIIRVKTGFTWKSFGEKIEVSIEEKNEAETLVTISSKPSLKTTVVDYGKNHENVKIVTSHLKSSFSKNG